MTSSRGLLHSMLVVLLCLGSFGASCSAQSGVPSSPDANPGRPTVSTPATLTPVGHLQFENGIQYAQDSTEVSTRVGLNQVTKLAVHPLLRLILLSEPLLDNVVAGQHDWQTSRVAVGTRVVMLT